MPKIALKIPLVSEKGYLQASNGAYSFYVDRNETKGTIKKKIEKMFKVEIVKINSQILDGKTKRVKGKIGIRSDRKKIIVKLKIGQKIDIFETEKENPKDKKVKNIFSKNSNHNKDKNET